MNTGKWSCVSQVDSHQFANCPMQWDNEFHWEIDQNPAAWRSKRHWEWFKLGIAPYEPCYCESGERYKDCCGKQIESFYRNLDTDTVDDFYVEKEVILGNTVRRSAPNYTGWSIVVKTVIRWEERRMKREIIVRGVRAPKHQNHKPADIERWEETHGTFTSNPRPSHRNRNSTRRRSHKRTSMGTTTI